MKSLNEYIMERHGMPVLSSSKLKDVWNKMRARLGSKFDDDLLEELDNRALNDVLWKLETKYDLGVMK